MNEILDPSQGCLELCIQVGKELYKRFNRRLGALGMTPVQAQVLTALAATNGLSMHALGARLCCVGSNVTAVVGRMAEAGWVERFSDPQDARVRQVRITPQGRELLAAATDAPRCCPELAALLSPTEWAHLRRLIGKIESRLQEDI